MTVGRDGVACACQANLVCAFGHYTVSGFDSGQDLYTFAIVGAEGHFLFLVAFFIELQVDEEDALLFRQGGAGHGYQCIREKSMVHTAVSHVQPLLVSRVCSSLRLLMSVRLPFAM